MRVDKIGEFGLIERIKRWVRISPSVIKGIGDDCAVLSYDKNKYLLFTADMLVEGVDFTDKTSPFLIGRKAIGMSISDIAAKGGSPKHALVCLGLPRKKSVKYVHKLYQGINFWAKKFKINIVGGDLSKSDKVIIDISMIGEVEKNKLALRSSAKIGDFIFVSGSLGGSIRSKHLTFTPRLKEAQYLVRNFKINSMIDISDGFIQDLGHILAASRVGATIHQELIPLSRKARNLDEALTMGEDFELLFTLPKNEAKRLIKIKSFSLIGRIVSKDYGLTLIDKNGRQGVIFKKGFRHF